MAIMIWAAGAIPTNADSESMDAGGPLWSGPSPSAGFTYLLLGLSASLILARWRCLQFGLMRGAGWMILLAWALLTAAWSIQIKTTLFNVASTGAALIALAYIAYRVEEAAFSTAVAYFAIGMTILCFFFGLALPQYGEMSGLKFAGQLRGIYSHKNLLGDVTTTLTAWLLCALYARQIPKRLGMIALLLCFITLVWAWSITSVLVIVFSVGLLAFYMTTRVLGFGSGWVIAVTFATLFVAIFVLTNYSAEILALVGKDSTLTGRDVIWQSYLGIAARHPLIGYGAYAVDSNANLNGLITFANGAVPSPHNSYIKMYAEFGAPATLFFIGLLAKLMLDGIIKFGMGDRVAIFRIVVPVCSALGAMTESTGGFSVGMGLIILFYLSTRKRGMPGRRVVQRRAAPMMANSEARWVHQ